MYRFLFFPSLYSTSFIFIIEVALFFKINLTNSVKDSHIIYLYVITRFANRWRREISPPSTCIESNERLKISSLISK